MKGQPCFRSSSVRSLMMLLNFMNVACILGRCMYRSGWKSARNFLISRLQPKNTGQCYCIRGWQGTWDGGGYAVLMCQDTTRFMVRAPVQCCDTYMYTYICKHLRASMCTYIHIHTDDKVYTHDGVKETNCGQSGREEQDRAMWMASSEEEEYDTESCKQLQHHNNQGATHMRIYSHILTQKESRLKWCARNVKPCMHKDIQVRYNSEWETGDDSMLWEGPLSKTHLSILTVRASASYFWGNTDILVLML